MFMYIRSREREKERKGRKGAKGKAHVISHVTEGRSGAKLKMKRGSVEVKIVPMSADDETRWWAPMPISGDITAQGHF